MSGCHDSDEFTKIKWLELEKDIENINKDRSLFRRKISDLENKLKELERFQDITDSQYKMLIKNKKPHKCPVCYGEGKNQTQSAVCEPFEKRIIDSLGRHFTECKSCDGKGIVWG